MNTAAHVSPDPCAGKTGKTCIPTHKPEWKRDKIFICPLCGRHYMAVLDPYFDNKTVRGWCEVGPVVIPDPSAAADLLAALKTAHLILSSVPITISQVLAAGEEVIDAYGLNPWCVNEGLADGSEIVGIPGCILAAIEKAEGRS